MYCRVIVDIVHENVAKPFTYLIPEGMALCPGQRVAVPFGAREKEGVVAEVTAECDVPPEKLRAVIRPLEDYAAIPPELMALAGEMAAQDHCPLAETLRLMLPFPRPGQSAAGIFPRPACRLHGGSQTLGRRFRARAAVPHPPWRCGIPPLCSRNRPGADGPWS